MSKHAPSPFPKQGGKGKKRSPWKGSMAASSRLPDRAGVTAISDTSRSSSFCTFQQPPGCWGDGLQTHPRRMKRVVPPSGVSTRQWAMVARSSAGNRLQMPRKKHLRPAGSLPTRPDGTNPPGTSFCSANVQQSRYWFPPLESTSNRCRYGKESHGFTCQPRIVARYPDHPAGGRFKPGGKSTALPGIRRPRAAEAPGS